jgi:hypothetical protein
LHPQFSFVFPVVKSEKRNTEITEKNGVSQKRFD